MGSHLLSTTRRTAADRRRRNKEQADNATNSSPFLLQQSTASTSINGLQRAAAIRIYTRQATLETPRPSQAVFYLPAGTPTNPQAHELGLSEFAAAAAGAGAEQHQAQACC